MGVKRPSVNRRAARSDGRADQSRGAADEKAADKAPPADRLNGLAPLFRVKPELQLLCRFGAQWAADHDAVGSWAPFHLVTHGACVLELTETGRAISLAEGDIAVLPHGSRHTLRGMTTPADARGQFGIATQSLGTVALKSNVAGAGATQLVCGRLRFATAHDNLVLAALPELLVVTTKTSSALAARLRFLMTAIQEELEEARDGAEAIATDLASALFIMVVRLHLEQAGRQRGVLALLAHPQAGRAVAAMLEDPAKRWSLDALAWRAHVSRASLVRLFRRLVRQAPLEFLAALRLDLARGKLAASALPVAAIAADCGYKSESAFSRAFHRRFGLRPGEARDAPAR